VGIHEKRLGKDGRRYPHRSNALRSEIRRVLEEDATASLRAVAARTGASPETVRAVRRSFEVSQRLEAPTCSPPEGRPISGETSSVWTKDSACASTPAGRCFAEWFDEHRLDEHVLAAMADSVPISRLYDVIDEARRRKDLWEFFAKQLQARVFRTSATGS
jgi:hypothetical protein